jgi:phosphatidylinositol glycan class B
MVSPLSMAITSHSSSKKMSAALFVLLAAFRIVNALLSQTQFDPDEYWQSLEVAYCHVFQDDCFRTLTWEWTRRAAATDHWLDQSLHGSVRSHISILPTYLWYQAIKFLGVDTSFAVSKGPMLVNAVVVAAVTDYSVWHLGSTITRGAGRWALFCSLTSWFNAYALVRTYSNSIETVLLIVGMVCLKQNKENLAFVLGGLSVANRFTCLAAWIPLGVLCAVHHHKSSSSWKSRLAYLFYPCATYGLFGFGLSLVVDRYFYGFWTIPVLGNFHFNVLEGMGSLYGTHPWYWYLLAGLPVISGLLLPVIVWGFVKHYNQPMWLIIATYLLLHSISAHKEFRFILPILPLLCIMGGRTLEEELSGGKKKRRRLLRILVIAVVVVANLIAFAYLGIIHQRAPLEVNKAIVQRISQEYGGDSTSESSRISIHYLMGCHSTPLYSHLHHTQAGVMVIDTWHLDCSPDCRRRCHGIDECAVPCESDEFHNDPVAFVKDAYTICTPPTVRPHHDGNDEGDAPIFTEPTCEYRNVPTFIAIYDSDAEKVKSQFQSMGLNEVGRFFHSIRGVRIFQWNVGDSPLTDSTLWGPTSWLDIHANEMILYQSPQY